MPPRSPGGSTQSRRSWPTAPRATNSAASCAARPTCRARLAGLNDPPPETTAIMDALRRPSRDLAREFARALAEQLPLIKRDGGFVRESYEPALDESRSLRDASRLVVAAMQARYADD